MMGYKERVFGPLPPVTLEELVPADHFYRHLERSLDLSFVRALVWTGVGLLVLATVIIGYGNSIA